MDINDFMVLLRADSRLATLIRWEARKAGSRVNGKVKNNNQLAISWMKKICR